MPIVSPASEQEKGSGAAGAAQEKRQSEESKMTSFFRAVIKFVDTTADYKIKQRRITESNLAP